MGETLTRFRKQKVEALEPLQGNCWRRGDAAFPQKPHVALHIGNTLIESTTGKMEPIVCIFLQSTLFSASQFRLDIYRNIGCFVNVDGRCIGCKEALELTLGMTENTI